MHDGSLETFDQVIEFYNGGGIDNAHIDSELRPLELSALEKRQLGALLNALTGTWPSEDGFALSTGASR